MVNTCVVVGCHFSYSRRKEQGKEGISIHAFPSRKEMKEAWIKAVRRVNWQPTAASGVCSQHFQLKDMDLTGQTRRLREGAVPSIFPSHPSHLQTSNIRKRKSPVRRIGTSEIVEANENSEPIISEAIVKKLTPRKRKLCEQFSEKTGKLCSAKKKNKILQQKVRRCNKWHKFCGLEHRYKTSMDVPRKNLRLCSDHFNQTEYYSVHMSQRRKLNSTAVPSIHSSEVVSSQEVSQLASCSPTVTPMLASPGHVTRFQKRKLIRTCAWRAKMQQAGTVQDMQTGDTSGPVSHVQLRSAMTSNTPKECYKNMDIGNVVNNSRQQSTEDGQTSASSQLPLTNDDDLALEIKVDSSPYTVGRLHKMCRLCATLVNVLRLTALFPIDGSQDLVNKINTFLPEKVSKGDGLPEHVCNTCINKLNKCVVTVQTFIAAGKNLKKLLQLTGTLPNIENDKIKKSGDRSKHNSTQNVVCAVKNPRSIVHAKLTPGKEESSSGAIGEVLRNENDTCLNEENVENTSPTIYIIDGSIDRNQTHSQNEEIYSLFENDNSQMNWSPQDPINVTHEIENTLLDSEYLCISSEVNSFVHDDKKTEKRNREMIETVCDVQDINKKIKIESSLPKERIENIGICPSAAISYVPGIENEKNAVVEYDTLVTRVIPPDKVYSKRRKERTNLTTTSLKWYVLPKCEDVS